MRITQGSRNRQKMINLMYIVLIALMGLDIHRSPTTQEQGYSHRPSTKGQEENATPTQSLDTAGLVVNINSERSLILKGDTYKAHIQLTRKYQNILPQHIYVDGQQLTSEQGLYQTKAQVTGIRKYSGYIALHHSRGNVIRYPFNAEYEVVEPSISVAPRLLNVLYAGIDNELDVSVSGVSKEKLKIQLEGGSVEVKNGGWIVRTHKREGLCKLSVYLSTNNATDRLLGVRELRVRPLPPPSPYLALSDGKRFRGGAIPRAVLLTSGEVRAATDDGILNLEYQIESFKTISFDSMGNAIPEVSNGAKFSERQLRQIQSSSRGRRLYITEIKARGADGVEHSIPALELIIQ